MGLASPPESKSVGSTLIQSAGRLVLSHYSRSDTFRDCVVCNRRPASLVDSKEPRGIAACSPIGNTESNDPIPTECCAHCRRCSPSCKHVLTWIQPGNNAVFGAVCSDQHRLRSDALEQYFDSSQPHYDSDRKTSIDAWTADKISTTLQ